MRARTSRLVATVSGRASIAARAASHRGGHGVADRDGQRRGGGFGDRRALDRGGQHPRRRLAAVAARRQLAIQLVVEFRRADLDDGRLAAASVEPLGQVRTRARWAALARAAEGGGSAELERRWATPEVWRNSHPSTSWTVAAGQALTASRSISSTEPATTGPSCHGHRDTSRCWGRKRSDEGE
jgi:hypothetical protein